MRVALDVSPLRLTRAGSARYVEGLRRELPQHVEVRELAWGGSGRAAAALRDAVWYPFALPRASRGSDLLHCPTFRAPLRTRVPTVVTVLDLAVLRHPELFNRWNSTYSRLTVPRVVRNARRVIAISEFTKRELVELLGVDPDRVTVIGVPPLGGLSPDGPRADGDYVLAVGTLEPRKNLGVLLAAWRLLRARLPEAPALVLCGAWGWSDDALRAAVAEGGREGWLHHRGYVAGEELAGLYRQARVVVLPSLHEGFGLPVVEALAAGTPLVVSDLPALREVAGDAALFASPYRPEEWADRLQELLADPALRAGLRRSAARRRAAFDWARTAEETVAAWRQAAAGSAARP